MAARVARAARVASVARAARVAAIIKQKIGSLTSASPHIEKGRNTDGPLVEDVH